MNILVIDDDRDKYSSIFRVFEEDPVNAFYFFDAPYDSGEEYLAGLVEMVKEADISAVFSLSYYRFISLACGVLKIPYLCWIVKGYEESSFDNTINNPWNHIFCADYDTFAVLEKAKVPNLTFMPLSFASDAVASGVPTKDILVITDDVEDLKSSSLKFDLLKDSSKGYLDGTLHSRKADLREKPFFENAAVYFREDMENCYPLSGGDYEPKNHKYDYRFFYPLLNNKTAHIIIFHITASWIKEDYKVDVLTQSKATDEVDHDRLTYYTRDGAIGNRPVDFHDYKLTVYFPRHEEKNVVSEEMLEIMSSNSLLLLPGYVSDKLLEDTGAVFFRNRYEITKLIEKYLYDEAARMEAVKANNAYVKRIRTYKEALDIIMNAAVD